MDHIDKLLLKAQQDIDIAEAALQHPNMSKKTKKEIKAKIKQFHKQMKRIRKLNKR